MTRIRFPREPVKIRVTLERYYSQTTPVQRANMLKTYEGIYCAIQTAIYTSTVLFGQYRFDLPRAIANVETMCDYSLGDVLLYDHNLSATETEVVLIGMAILTTDIYIAINTYAQWLLEDGYDIEDLADLIAETDWEIYSDNTQDLDDTDEIYLVIDQSVSEWMDSNKG